MTSNSRSPLKKRGRPRTGRAMSAAERMRRLRARRKAAGFKPMVKWIPRSDSARPPYSRHRLLEARSLTMHALIANKIDRDRSLLEIPRRNLERWNKGRRSGLPAWQMEWKQILTRPWPEVAALITEPSENAARLRQSSPFAGVLSNAERERIYEAFRA